MSGKAIPDDQHIVRCVPYSKLRRDEDGNVVGFTFSAFTLRPNETYLSATWAEHARPVGTHDEQVTAAVHAMRNSDFTPGPRAGFAIGIVGDIKAATKLKLPRAASILHEPDGGNESHAALRGWPPGQSDVTGLFELLAAEVWSPRVMNADIP